MCDDSGTTDGEVIVDLGEGLGEFVVLDLHNLDEQTKRELLIAGPPRTVSGKSPDPKCRWCKGTGKVKLLVSESDCDCTKPIDGSRHQVCPPAPRQ